MKILKQSISLLLLLACLAGLCACKSNKVMVEASNDMEIYVGATLLPVEYSYRNQTRKPFTDFPIYNTLILYPAHGVYTFQVYRNMIKGSVGFIPEFMTGSYITRNDTIICIPDIVYKKNPENFSDYGTAVSDTVNLQYAPSFRPKYFKRTSKDRISDVTPNYDCELFDAELDFINKANGYVWTLEDFEFNRLSSEQKAKLKMLSDRSREHVRLKNDKGDGNEIYPEYQRVPFDVKSEKTDGRLFLNWNEQVKYYKPAKQ